MKLRNFGQYALWMAAFLVAGPVKSASAQNWAINVVSLETIVKVQQQHVPGVGANYLALNIDGKSGGKPMSVSLSVNSPGWGAQKIIDSCEKNAMLAMHYPSRYVFEVVSEDTGQDGSVRLNVSDGASDAVTCSLKSKSQLSDPVIPVTPVLKSVN